MKSFSPILNSQTFKNGATTPRQGDSKTMKNTTPMLLAGLIAGCLATTALAAPQFDAAPQPPAQPPAQAQPVATTQTNAAPVVAPPTSNPNVLATSGTAEQGMTLNLRGVSVDKALAFLADSAGFTINRQAQTSMAGTVDLVSDKPISKEEIVAVFNKVLADHGLTAVQDKNILTIESLDQAFSSAPVNLVSKAEDITADEQVVTDIIPVHSLNPTQVVKDLFTLLPRNAQMNTSEAGNAIIMTATQADIKRFAQIIAAIDSTGNGDLQVFLLKYADSKALASELKDVFTSQDTTPGINPFAMFGRGGRGGGGGGGANADESSKRAAVHVNAVSDDENNAVLVSAPADFMGPISNIIEQLDIPQDDAVMIKRFVLHNADCNDVANELTSVFPDPNQQANQNGNNGGRRGAATFGAAGGGRFGGGAAANTPGSGMSDRMKKQITVNAVADARTQSVLITASKDTMTQIERIIDELDSDPSGHMNTFVFYPQFADVLDLQGPMQDLFQQTGRSSSSTTTQQNALLMRMQSGAQAQSSAMSSSANGLSSSSMSGGGSSSLR
jgi:type II secretory pathway component GspD/PulD (secretin)